MTLVLYACISDLNFVVLWLLRLKSLNIFWAQLLACWQKEKKIRGEGKFFSLSFSYIVITETVQLITFAHRPDHPPFYSECAKNMKQTLNVKIDLSKYGYNGKHGPKWVLVSV